MAPPLDIATDSFADLLMASVWNGARLVEIRIAAGYATPKSLADAIDYAPSTITRWELGQRSPGADELFAVSEFLSVSCEEFRKPVGSPIRFKRKAKADGE